MNKNSKTNISNRAEQLAEGRRQAEGGHQPEVGCRVAADHDVQ